MESIPTVFFADLSSYLFSFKTANVKAYFIVTTHNVDVLQQWTAPTVRPEVNAHWVPTLRTAVPPDTTRKQGGRRVRHAPPAQNAPPVRKRPQVVPRPEVTRWLRKPRAQHARQVHVHFAQNISARYTCTLLTTCPPGTRALCSQLVGQVHVHFTVSDT